MDSDINLDEEEVKLLCGCGKCTLNDFLEKGCPDPGGPKQFPLLNLERLPRRSSQKLVARLMKESKLVAKEFGSLSAKLLSCLNDREDITVDHLVLFLLPQQRFSYICESRVPEIEKQLRKATTKGEVLKLLPVSWFNHTLFESIAKEFKVAIEDYKNYIEQHLNPLLQKSLFEIPRKFSYVFKGSNQFTLKMDIPKQENLKADILICLKDQVAGTLGISIDALDFCGYDSGCLEIVFSAPYVLVKKTFSIKRKFPKVFPAIVSICPDLKIQSVQFEGTSLTAEVS